MVNDDPEDALFQICAAVEATAKREGRRKGRAGFKEFILDNMPIICGVGLMVPIAGLRLNFRYARLPVSEQDGTTGIEDILYHVCRCALYHTATLPDAVEFTTDTLGGGPDKILLPKQIVSGIVLAVVGSHANKKERTKSNYCINVNDETFELNSCWGMREGIKRRLIAMSQAQPAASAENHG